MYVAYILGNQLFFPLFFLGASLDAPNGSRAHSGEFWSGPGSKTSRSDAFPDNVCFFWLSSIRGDLPMCMLDCVFVSCCVDLEILESIDCVSCRHSTFKNYT
jgi:hypothetical protein